MMNRLAASIFILLLSIATARAADDIVGPLRTQWGITRDLVVNLVQIMPEDKYDYKPTPEIRSFREIVGHLILENYNFMSMVAGEPAPDKAKFEALKSRDELTKALAESYAFGERTLATLTDAKAVGITAGASAPEVLVDDVIEALRRIGPVTVSVLPGREENIEFRLPAELAAG